MCLGKILLQNNPELLQKTTTDYQDYEQFPRDTNSRLHPVWCYLILQLNFTFNTEMAIPSKSNRFILLVKALSP